MAAVPYEIWLQIFQHLDIPDIYTCLFVSHDFHAIAADRYLHRQRLKRTAHWLAHQYPQRPTASELCRQRVLVSAHQAHLSPEVKPAQLELILNLSRQLKRDVVARGLRRRPAVDELTRKGILAAPPWESSPSIERTRKQLQHQQKVDTVRALYNDRETRPSLETAVKRGIVDYDQVDRQDPMSVQRLTRMFAYWMRNNATSTNLRNLDNVKRRRQEEAPTRALVYKMKQQFEQHVDPANVGNAQHQQQQQQQQQHPPLTRQCTGVSFGVVASLRQHFVQLAC